MPCGGLGLGGLDRGVGSQPGDGADREGHPALERSDRYRLRDRNPDVDRCQLCPGESRRSDTDDREAVGVHLDRSSQNLVIATVPPLPVFLGQDRDRIRLKGGLLQREESAYRRSYAEKGKRLAEAPATRARLAASPLPTVIARINVYAATSVKASTGKKSW